jgi:type IV pilus assembly protein PilA
MMKKQKGFSLIELLIVVAIILIIAAIAIPNLLKSKMAANESSAVGSLRTYNTAMVTYAAQCPTNGYPAGLVQVGPGVGDCTAANIVDNVLGVAAPTKSGYKFAYKTPGTSGGAAGATYDVNADPINRGTTGQRSFFTDQSGVIRYNQTAASVQGDPSLQ